MLNKVLNFAGRRVTTSTILIVAICVIALTISLLFYHQLGPLVSYLFVLIVLLLLLRISRPKTVRCLLPASFHIFVCAVADSMKYVITIWPMLFTVFYTVSRFVDGFVMYSGASISLTIAFVTSMVLARRRSKCVDSFIKVVFGARLRDLKNLRNKLEYYFVLFVVLFLLAILLLPFVHYIIGLTHIWNRDVYGFLELIGDVGYILLIIYLWFLLMMIIFSPIEVSQIDQAPSAQHEQIERSNHP